MSEGIIVAMISAGGAVLAAVVAAWMGRKGPPPLQTTATTRTSHDPSRSDQLLDDLISRRERITYRAAYALLIGLPPTKRWSQSYREDVAREAGKSKQAQVSGLTIYLDALVVLDEDGEPTDSHFENKPYDRTRWRSVFGGWGIRRT